MDSTSDVASVVDPFQVLGLSRDAGDDEVRSRYLELVKQFPPDRDPERFREIHAAYQAAKDPLVIARRLLEPPSDTPRPWSEVIDEQAGRPPRLTVELLLSLGNREDEKLRIDEEHDQ